MRKITRLAVQAMANRENFKLNNTEVRSNQTGSVMLLHGNPIACISQNKLYIDDGGWQSVTTKERLNGLLSEMTASRGIQQRKFVWYLDGKEWDGDWVQV